MLALIRRWGTSALALAVIAFAGCGGEDAGDAAAGGVVSTTLSNGIRVIIQPYDGTKEVAVEAMYGAGMVDEPRGYPQIAHLMEHLAFKSPTDTYKAGEVWERMNSIGSVNAETMPGFTHFDYLVSSRDLEEVLSVEANRLKHIRIDENVVREEALLCYSEIEALERMAIAPVVKFAAMAAHQNWRYGIDTVRVHSGLEEIPLESLALFFQENYQPANLMIVIVGDVKAQRALKLVEKYFGDIHGPGGSKQPIAWAQIPPVSVVTWDVNVPGVFVWYEPPVDPREQIVMSLWGNVVRQRLLSDIELTTVTRFMMPNSYIWPVGQLPFFVYASAGSGYSAAAVARAIADRIDFMLSSSQLDNDGRQVRDLGAQLSRQSQLDESTVAAQVQMLAQRGIDEDDALGRVLLQHAINLGMRELFFDHEVEANLEWLRTLSPLEVTAIVERTLDPARRHVTILEPGS